MTLLVSTDVLESPAKDNKDHCRVDVGEAERAGAVQPGEEKAPGRPYNMRQYLTDGRGRRWRQTLLSGAQHKSQASAQTETQEILFKYKNVFLL